MCGGSVLSRLRRGNPTGLSPRVRGIQDRRGNTVLHRGSIPACAGDPCPRSVRHARSRVYPRVCGGSPCGPRDKMAEQGLSPRVRGILRRVAAASRDFGSIPACAGDPSMRRSFTRISWVYPRVCGGSMDGEMSGWQVTGLSPRVRGIHASGSCGSGRRGSIPACAGDPTKSGITARLGQVYPRVCGGSTSLAS